MKERLKAIWHILFDREYIVFTVTVKDGKRTRSSALISNDKNSVLIDVACEVLTDIKNKER